MHNKYRVDKKEGKKKLMKAGGIKKRRKRKIKIKRKRGTCSGH